jgi:dihydroorotate dehydrogenase electron transfer subunit
MPKIVKIEKSHPLFQSNAKLIKNIEVAPNYYKMVLAAPSVAKAAKPGQFIDILIGEKYEPLLRRPFSIHRVLDSNIEILYSVIGKGTRLLSGKKPGERLDILGPLGNGFSILDSRRSILVAGGMGVAPLVFLAEKLTSIKHRASSIKHLVFLGAKTKNQILCEKEFKDLGCEVKVTTDDGSGGFKGYVSDLLKKELYATRYTLHAIYACGPKLMLKEIAKISQKNKIPAQISLEEHMACGIGVCFGCAVKTKNGYKRVCKEGPVFNAGDIVF